MNTSLPDETIGGAEVPRDMDTKNNKQTSSVSQKGGMFFADNFRPKIPAVAAAMFMPRSWSINRRNKRAAEKRAVLDTLKRGR